MLEDTVNVTGCNQRGVKQQVNEHEYYSLEKMKLHWKHPLRGKVVAEE